MEWHSVDADIEKTANACAKYERQDKDRDRIDLDNQGKLLSS